MKKVGDSKYKWIQRSTLNFTIGGFSYKGINFFAK